MKKLILSFFVLAFALGVRAQGTFGPGGDLVPFGNFPIVTIGNVQGSLHVENDTTDLEDWLKLESIVYQISNGTFYRFSSGTWIEITTGGGGSVGAAGFIEKSDGSGSWVTTDIGLTELSGENYLVVSDQSLTNNDLVIQAGGAPFSGLDGNLDLNGPASVNINSENGNVIIEGLTWPADGTNGQYLQTNGSGVLSFSTVPSGGSSVGAINVVQTSDGAGGFQDSELSSTSALGSITLQPTTSFGGLNVTAGSDPGSAFSIHSNKFIMANNIANPTDGQILAWNQSSSTLEYKDESLNTDDQDASEVLLSDPVNSTGTVQAALEDHETRIDVLEGAGGGGSVGGVNTIQLSDGSGGFVASDLFGNGNTITSSTSVILQAGLGNVQLNGGVNIGGNYNLPNLDGTTNQVLTTNGLGTVFFADPLEPNYGATQGMIPFMNATGDAFSYAPEIIYQGLGSLSLQNVLVQGGSQQTSGFFRHYMDEVTAAGSISAGQGLLWVRDDSPNVLMFTDDTGVDHNLLAGGGGSDGVVSNVALNTTSLDFTGSNGGFNGSVELSSLQDGTGTDDQTLQEVLTQGATATNVGDVSITNTLGAGVGNTFTHRLERDANDYSDLNIESTETVGIAGQNRIELETRVAANNGGAISISSTELIPTNNQNTVTQMTASSVDDVGGTYTAILNLTATRNTSTGNASNSVTISSTDPSFAGIQEQADYSGNYSALSLTNKTYVDAQVASAADGVVTNVALNTTNLDFTGTGGGFNGSVDLSSLQDGTGTDDQTAIEVPITDIGGFYTGTEVETALQEIGAASAIALTEVLEYAITDETSPFIIGNTKLTVRVPYACTITAIRMNVSTAPTGSDLIVDINESGTTILSTKLSIDDGEKTSVTAATPAVISDAALADNAELTFDVDQRGSTFSGAGVKVQIYVTRI